MAFWAESETCLAIIMRHDSFDAVLEALKESLLAHMKQIYAWFQHFTYQRLSVGFGFQDCTINICVELL